MDRQALPERGLVQARGIALTGTSSGFLQPKGFYLQNPWPWLDSVTTVDRIEAVYIMC